MLVCYPRSGTCSRRNSVCCVLVVCCSPSRHLFYFVNIYHELNLWQFNELGKLLRGDIKVCYSRILLKPNEPSFACSTNAGCPTKFTSLPLWTVLSLIQRLSRKAGLYSTTEHLPGVRFLKNILIKYPLSSVSSKRLSLNVTRVTDTGFLVDQI